jgi:hypothetical protein
MKNRIEQAKRNREKMPQIAAFMDELKQFIPEAKVVYAKEGGIEIGNKDEKTTRAICPKSY